jgi:CRISPR-associated endonuclease/helicase Cas3
MRDIYYAKSKLKNGYQPTNREHLQAVSNLAGQFAAVFGCQEEGALAGLFHDFGKYSEAFQQVLEGRKKEIDHAICGAVMLYTRMLFSCLVDAGYSISAKDERPDYLEETTDTYCAIFLMCWWITSAALCGNFSPGKNYLADRSCAIVPSCPNSSW